MKVTISGQMQMQTNLSRLNGVIDEASVRRMLLDAAKPMVDTAKRLAPLDKGDLRDSIEAVVENGPDGPTVSVGSTSPIAHLVEFGTGGHTNGGQYAGTKHPGTPAQPFLRPAWDATEGAAEAGIGRDVMDIIDREIIKGVSTGRGAGGKTGPNLAKKR